MSVLSSFRSSAPDTTLFAAPFSKAYWRLAAREVSSTRMLVIAAVITALRIAVKMLDIPVGPSLNITFGFLFNAVGSMIYGPVMAILTSAVSDTVGALLFPNGTYFFPFIFEEIAGGVLFALFFYRAKISTTRIALGRLAVTVVCNFVINPLLMCWYYAVFFTDKLYALTWLKVVKNWTLFPVQAVILVLLFNLVLPLTNRERLTYTGSTRLRITKKDGILLAVLTVVAAAALIGYALWRTAGK